MPFFSVLGEQEAGHVPTAERVYQIFDGENSDPQPPEPFSDEEELLEIDYADLGKFMTEFEVAAASSKKTTTDTLVAATTAAGTPTTLPKDDSHLVVTAIVEESPGFYIDTMPSPVEDSPTSTDNIAVEILALVYWTKTSTRTMKSSYILQTPFRSHTISSSRRKNASSCRCHWPCRCANPSENSARRCSAYPGTPTKA
jgi:hypothetical protein